MPYALAFPDVQDWDDPPTCILWSDFQSALNHTRSHGVLPSSHASHDHLNKQVEVNIDSAIQARWTAEFERLAEEQVAKNVELVFFIVDGFVLYWDPVRSTNAVYDVLTAGHRQWWIVWMFGYSFGYHTRFSKDDEKSDRHMCYRVSAAKPLSLRR